jgi:RNA polymerase sigma-70 factor, ECF subfamily
MEMCLQIATNSDARRRLVIRSRVVGQQSNFNALPEATVLQRVARGDKAAVQECIDRFGGLVWSLARRFCYNSSDSEDAVQEIFLDLWRSAGRYDPSVASEATFVAMISRRRLIDRRRRASRQPTVAELQPNSAEAGSSAVGSTLDVAEDARAAVEALESLRPEQQRVLRLSIYQGLSHEKIAEATGLPLGTVKTHVRRGLIRIREMLGGEAGAASSAEGPEDSVSSVQSRFARPGDSAGGKGAP